MESGGCDLLISDLGLPDGSGLDLVREMRGRGVTRSIAMTGHADDGDAAACVEAGFSAFIPKPVSLGALEAVMGRLLADGPPGRTAATPRRIPADPAAR